MKIARLEAEGFGVWSGLVLDQLPDSLTVIYGPNEAGKTTLMQLIRTVLYGFSAERRRRYVPAVFGGDPGGRLQIDSPNGTFLIHRALDLESSPSDRGELTVTATDGTVQGQHLLDVLLAGVDEAIYNNVFAVGLRELQELATLDETAAAELLYGLAGGLDRVSLVEVLRELASSRERIVAPDGTACRIAGLIDEREAIRRELESCAGSRSNWTELAQQQSDVDSRIARQDNEFKQLKDRVKLLELALTLMDRWAQHAEIQGALNAEPELSSLPSEELGELDRIAKAIDRRRRRHRQLGQQREQLRHELEQIPGNNALGEHRSRIEALHEQQTWIGSLQDTIQRLDKEVVQLDLQLSEEQARVGVPAGYAYDQISSLLAESGDHLRPRARSMRQRKRKLDQAKIKLADVRKRRSKFTEQIEATLDARGQSDLAGALQIAGGSVARFRDRAQLEQRLDLMKRHREELEEQSHRLFDGQILPIWVLTVLGGLFAIGVMLILAGLLGGVLFSLGAVAGWALALLGLAGTGAAAASKILLERSAADQLQSCHKKLELLDGKIENARHERDELDAKLPTDGGPLAMRLKAAEADLADLEQLRPIAEQRQVAGQRIKTARRRVTQADDAYQIARRRWRMVLESLGLPQELSPVHVRRLVGGQERMVGLERRVEECRQELAQRKMELAEVSRRIATLLDDVGIDPESDDPVARVLQLRVVLGQQKRIDRQRDAIRRRAQIARRQYAKHIRVIDKLHRRRRLLLPETEATDEHDLQQLIGRIEEVRQRQDDRNRLSVEIDTALADHCTREEMAELIDGKDGEEIERRLEGKWERQQSLESELNQLHQTRGAMSQRLKSLMDDRAFPMAQLRLGCVEQKLREAVRRWQLLAVTSLILESIRRLYETERQPETLQKASSYLKSMTEENYLRIWTPLGEDALKVEDAQGKSLSVDLLSSGTREQVFLSIRLALAASYAGRGACLPLVLDDVLVNFDADRAKATARVLRDFAKSGHQMFVFTCHQHIMKMFKALKVEIRQLPDFADVARHADTVEAADTIDEPGIVDLVQAPNQRDENADEESTTIDEAASDTEEIVELATESVHGDQHEPTIGLSQFEDQDSDESEIEPEEAGPSLSIQQGGSPNHEDGLLRRTASMRERRDEISTSDDDVLWYDYVDERDAA